MGAFAVPLMAAATVASAGLAYKAQTDAGKLAEIEGKERAEQERQAAQDREIDRKRRLMRALGNQQATAAARNLDINIGSTQAIALHDIKQAERDQLVDTVNTDRRRRSLIFAGNQANRTARIGANASLIDAGMDAYRDFG